MATGRVPTTANSPLTAKGDLFGYSTTQARVAVGNDGETLVADSSTSTGLRYQAPVNANPVINSAMQIAQRGTSFALTGGISAYTLDRWAALRNVTGATITRQTTSDTTNLPFIQNCARIQRDSGNTSTAPIYFANNFETVNSIPYAGKTVTLSFYARAGANYSGNLVTRLYTGTGTDQNILASYTGAANPIAQNTTLTTTWQRFSYTATLAATATELAPRFDYEPTGTAGAADYYEITGVQLEVGSVATPFKTYAGTIQGELAACQRYYWRQTGQAYLTYGTGSAQDTRYTNIVVNNPVAMRTVASAIEYANLAVFDGQTIVGSPTAIVLLGNNSSQLVSYVQFDKTGSVGQYRPYVLLNNNNAAGYLGLSAEL